MLFFDRSLSEGVSYSNGKLNKRALGKTLVAGWWVGYSEDLPTYRDCLAGGVLSNMYRHHYIPIYISIIEIALETYDYQFFHQLLFLGDPPTCLGISVIRRVDFARERRASCWIRCLCCAARQRGVQLSAAFCL